MSRKKPKKWDTTPSSSPLEFRIAGRLLPLGWFVLLFPLSIVVFLSLFEGPAWITERAEIGAEGEAAGHNTLGLAAMRRESYREAYGHFMTALDILPDYAEAYMNLGILSQLKGDSRNAILNLKKALDLGTKQDDLIYNNLGKVYGEMHDDVNALAMFERALVSQVKVLPIYRNIAQVQQRLEDYPAAIATLKKAISHHPNRKVLFEEMLKRTKKIGEEEEDLVIVDSLIQRGVYPEDLEEFDAVIIDEYNRRDPKIAGDYAELGKLYDKTGAFDNAVEAYSKAIELAQDKSVYYNKLGTLYARNGIYDLAYDAFQAAVEFNPDNRDARQNLEQCRQILTRNSDE